MAEPTVQLLLRVSPDLKKQIEDAARENQRSINFEAIKRLERSFLDEPLQTSMVSADDVIRALAGHFNDPSMLNLLSVKNKNRVD